MIFYNLHKHSQKSVVIAIAMEAEAAPFIKHLNLQQDTDFFHKKSPFQAFRGKHNSCNLTVITNGKDTVHGTGVDNVGTTPAVLATWLALDKLDNGEHTVDLLINAGTCGGFQRKGAEIGNVYLTTAVAHHDRRIPIPGFVDYGVGKVESLKVEQVRIWMDGFDSVFLFLIHIFMYISFLYIVGQRNQCQIRSMYYRKQFRCT
jgi:5'-methylthioadenosine nucleosidase